MKKLLFILLLIVYVGATENENDGITLTDIDWRENNDGIIYLNDGSYQICTHTFKTIKQNLFWAFAYNLIAIPLAAMGYLSPIFAALTMAFSDVVVIGNSIRLKYKNINS